MSVADRVREARGRLGVSARGLAERARLSPGLVALIESGQRRNISLTTAHKLAVALGVSIEWLAEDERLRDETGPLPDDNDAD